MNRTRLLILATSAVTLLISACSQPQDFTEPEVTPQYGTSNFDSASLVASNEAGYLYTLGTINYDYENAAGVLKRFDTSGKELWSRKLTPSPHNSCSYPCEARNFGLSVDTAGNVYALHGSKDEPDEHVEFNAWLSKFSPSGTLLWKVTIYGDGGFGGSSNLGGSTAMVTTAAGETFIAYDFTKVVSGDGGFEYVSSFHLAKFGASGKKLFDKSLAIDYPSDAAITKNGLLCLVGGGEVAKYSNTDTLLWKRSLPIRPYSSHQQIAVGNAKVYVSTDTNERFGSENHSIAFYRYTTSGTKVWERTLTKPSGSDKIELSGLSADAEGNVHLAGVIDGNKFTLSDPAGNTAGDFFVRKYTPLGNSAWTYAPKLPSTYEFANNVSAGDSGRVYVVGETNAKVNGKNYGHTDAFLIRLDTSGKKVWSR